MEIICSFNALTVTFYIRLVFNCLVPQAISPPFFLCHAPLLTAATTGEASVEGAAADWMGEAPSSLGGGAGGVEGFLYYVS
jgi:hypothetical protein